MSQQDYENGLKVRTEVMGKALCSVLRKIPCLLASHYRTGLMNMPGVRPGNVKVFYRVNIVL